MKSAKFPPIPKGLVDLLSEQFPDQCPRSDPGAFGLGVLSGQQQVIDLIRTTYERQQESSIDVRPQS